MVEVAVIDIRFSVDGVAGRELVSIEPYDNETDESPSLKFRAWGELEDELIRLGFDTWECGCCLRGDCGVEWLSAEVFRGGH